MALVQMSSVEEAIEALIVSSGDQASLAAATCKNSSLHVYFRFLLFLDLQTFTSDFITIFSCVFICTYYVHVVCVKCCHA